MNPGTALYEFTRSIKATSTGALANALLHLDVDTPFTGIEKKWIRFSGMRSGEPVLINNEIRVDNAVHQVWFVVQPESQSAVDRVAARELSQNIANEWLKEVFESHTLGGRVCSSGNIKQIDDWMMPITVKMPVTVIQITINPR